MHSEAEDHRASRPLPAALAAQRTFWPEPRTDVGDLEAGCITSAALFADDAAIDAQLDYQGSFDEGVDQKSRAAFLMSDYCAMFSVTTVPLLVGAGMVPDLAMSTYAMQFYRRVIEHDGLSAEVQRAHVRYLSFAYSTDRESEAAHPDARALLDRAGLCACYRQGVEAHFSPIIEALNRKTGLPRSAMWRLVGDALAVAFLDAGRRYDRLDDAKAMAMAVLKQPGSPLANRQLHYFDVTVRDDAQPDRVLASYTFRARGGCCRYYRIEGRKLCSTCVLQSAATRERLLQNTLRRRLGLPVSETA